MAMAAELNGEKGKEDFDDLLICTICLEFFKEPKYLPCLHTFCKSCISTYIGSIVDVNNPNGFKCPVCRRYVPIDENDEKSDTWANNLPGNNFIISLINRKLMQKSGKLCDVCKQENISQKAISFCSVCEEAFCEACQRYHKLFKITKGHTIVAISVLNEDTTVSGLYAPVTCKEHSTKTIEVYCQDHSKTCCTVCATVHHRKCGQVVTIDKAMIGIKVSDQAKTLMTKLKEISKTLGEVLQNRNNDKQNFENEIQTVLEELPNIRERFCNYLHDLEQKLRDEANSGRKENVIKLDDETTDLSSLKSTVDNWKNIFEACISQGSEIQCLVKMDEIINNLPQTENDIYKLLREIKTISVKFKQTDISSFIRSLGRLEFEEDRPSIPGVKIANYHTGKVVKAFTIDASMRYVSGIFFNNDIILTYHNCSKIVYYDHKGQQKNELKVPQQVTDITKVDNRTVAVSSDEQKIFVLKVNPLIILRTLIIDNPVWGVSFCENEFVTANRSIISWINAESGTVIKTASTTENTKFVTCERKNEYIHRNCQHSIKKESNHGHGFTYSHHMLLLPFSQDVDSDGNIYITGHQSKNIHQLTSSGRLVRIIPISEIDKSITASPGVIRFQPNSNRFLLTFNDGNFNVLVCEID